MYKTLTSHILLSILMVYTFDVNADTDAWELVKDNENIQTYTVSIDTSDIVKAKAVAIFDASLIEVRTVLNEVEKRKLWVPYLLNASIHKTIDKQKRIEYAHFAAPWPASDRDFIYMHSEITTDDASIFYKMKSVQLSEKGEVSGRVRGEILESSYTLLSLDDNRTKIELIYHVDPKGWLPSWIVNIIQRALPYKILYNLKKKLIENQQLTEQ